MQPRTHSTTGTHIVLVTFAAGADTEPAPLPTKPANGRSPSSRKRSRSPAAVHNSSNVADGYYANGHSDGLHSDDGYEFGRPAPVRAGEELVRCDCTLLNMKLQEDKFRDAHFLLQVTFTLYT